MFNYEYENEFFLNSMHRYWKKTITKITIIFEEVPEKEIYMNKKKDGILRLRFQYSYSKSRNGRTLMNDFRQTDSDKIHYAALAKGVKHFKDTEKGREQMCEAVEKYAKEYAKEYAVKEKMISVKNLMENMKLTVDQALNALGIQGDERKTIINQLQNRN